MQSLNILIAGSGESAALIQESKLLNKLYVTAEIEIPGAVNITYNTFEELAVKCKSLHIDIVVVDNENLLFAGIVDKLKKYRINCIGVNEKWAQIAYSGLSTKKILNRYEINNPLVLTFPKSFPLVLKVGRTNRIADSMQELIKIRQTEIPSEFANEIFLEEYIAGESYTYFSLFDGKNLLSLPAGELRLEQKNALEDYHNKLATLLVAEKADFVGFFNTKLVWANSKWYVIDFSLGLPDEIPDKDILYILINAIYQKLNEITFCA